MPTGEFDPDEQPEEELSPFQLIERAVDLALQAHGIHGLEVRATVGEIVQVAQELSKADPDFRKSMFDPRKMTALEFNAFIDALAIYIKVGTKASGRTSAQFQKRLMKRLRELGDV